MTDFHPAPSPGQIAEAAHAFARNGRIRIPDFLQHGAAEALHAFLQAAPWWRTFNQGERTWDLGPESIEVLTPEQASQLEQAIHEGARKGFQYVYETVRVSEQSSERSERGFPVDRLLEAMNTAPALEMWRELTGDPDVGLVDGQATRYLPGHFLTRHDDDVEGKNRVAAYVLNLSPEWAPEWGGLLQFHDAAGEVTGAMVPGFNVLNLFRVPQSHSVSIVAPFAPAPRYSITGWIRRG
ncbi:2OG-Fe(II) oxygenase [Altererythrobacter sp. C41]|uniref:2OG-Fe(II) oxygenase n=1 Tax=Altererythrobacter sp. C41 TaxID=2806021 RepID=UPI001932C980|nr:2OG-Fe(II) oxygenase family protein [Altererythrobacter sp. C41]MBM0170935.1 2OG-Fe(II) oxygenase [Altererythrobacter sp. C41]